MSDAGNSPAHGPFLRRSGDILGFWCPGCKELHILTCYGNGAGPRWSFDENLEAPTFAPSVLVSRPGRPDHPRENHRTTKTLCHLFVRAGRIEFLSDSAHALAGQTVPMAPIPEDWGF